MVVRVLAVVVLLACALAWRMPASPPEWRFAICENDSLYQLHRIDECLHEFPAVESVDAQAHFPHGYRVPWMPLHTLFYASVVRFAGLEPRSLDELAAAVSWIPPLFGLLSLLLVLGVAGCFTRNRWCVLAIGALYAFNPDVSRPFIYGTIDHHLFAHFGVLLMVWGRLRLRLWAWALGSMSLLAMTPEAIIFVSALLGCFFAASLAARTGANADLPQRSWPWLMMPAAVAMLGWLAGRGIETDGLPASDLTWMYPTLFTPLWLATLGATMAATLALVAPRGRVTMFRAAAAVALVGAAATLCLLATGALQSAVVRLLGGGGRMFVSEEAAVFRQGFWNAAAGRRMVAFSSLYVVFELFTAARAGRSASEWFGWLALAMSLLLGFVEFRHLYVLSSLQVIALGLAVFAVERMLRAMAAFSGPTRWVPAAVLALAIVPFVVSEDVLGRDDASGEVCAMLPTLEDLSAWLAANTPAETDAPSYAVFARWSIGHHLHVLGQRPVVVDPFNYDLEGWVQTALERVWHARTVDELGAALRRYSVRYLVLTNPWAEIVDTLPANGDVRSEDLVEHGPRGEVTFKPALAQYAGFRLFMSAGALSEFGELQPRYFTEGSEHYTARSAAGEPQPVAIPRGQIYELKPGAVLHGRVPPGVERASLRYRLRRRGAEPVEIEIPLALAADGEFRHRTSLPAPVTEETFAVEGPYRITAGEQMRNVEVTQAMIDEGATVEVSWQ